jgi:hypothetical protein
MALDHLDEYRSVYAACQAIGPKVGVGAESLRQRTLQAEVDASQRGSTAAELVVEFADAFVCEREALSSGGLVC